MKRCSMCKTEKSDDDFAFKSSTVKQSHCRSCKSEYNKIWYSENRSKVRDSNARIRNEKREYIREQKNRPCADCGILYPYYVMDFDHIGAKSIEPNKLRHKSWELIRSELEQCEVVCSNCHRERTQSRL